NHQRATSRLGQKKMAEQFLNGQTAVVTGGTRGIGFSIAKALAESGANIVICGRKQQGVDDAVRQLTVGGNKVAGKVADVRSSTEVTQLFAYADQQFGGIDILINNAGLGIFRRTGELSVSEWQETIETNLSGVFYGCREALTRMAKRGA